MDDGEGLGASWFRVLIVWFDSPKWPSLGNLSPAWARRAVAARVPLTTFSTAQCLQKKNLDRFGRFLFCPSSVHYCVFFYNSALNLRPPVSTRANKSNL